MLLLPMNFAPVAALRQAVSQFVMSFVLLSTLLISSPASAQELADVIEKAEQSVIRIEVSGVDGDSLGSGFVIDDQGTIITNCHVLAGATSAVAHFPNGRSSEIQGTLVIDETRDIIVARIGLRDAPPISLASSLPRKGEEVTALGSPHGLSFTATTGIVSAIRPAREMASDVGRTGVQGTWIQVDAAISPGNSGGPLINSAGQVVAMSTLASQGSAQNLNFGISAKDIGNAIKYSRYGRLTSLRLGAANVRMSDGEPGPRGSPGGGGGSAITSKNVPEDALLAYVKRGKEDYSELMRGLRMEAARLRIDLKDMRNGTTRLPPALAREGITIARTPIPGKRSKRWYFVSLSVKDEAIREQNKRISNYDKLKNQIQDINDPDSLFKLLWNYGPAINIRDNRSVGFMTDLFILHAFNSHDAIAVYEENPYLLWLDSTAGINGGEIHTGPIFVAGTATAEIGNIPRAVTILQEVTKEQLRSAITKVMGSSSEAAPGFRVWSDKTGKHKIAAKLLGSDSQKAILQKQDGTIIDVPINSLSEADQSLIRQQ